MCIVNSNEMHGVVEYELEMNNAIESAFALQIARIRICNSEFEIREIPGDAGGGWGGERAGRL